MTQSAIPPGLHVGLIMDGNGRWASRRGRPRIAGHREGARSVRRVVQAAPGLGIGTLTLYAFSADNWQRPPEEVAALMDLFGRYLRSERARCLRHGVRVNVIGRRDRLDPGLVETIRATERATRAGSTLHLRLAVDYSARHSILTAASRLGFSTPVTEATFVRLLNRVTHSTPAAPDVDLLIRTSGEQRLSDFLLWESAYAELVFIDRLWPDFDADDLTAAIIEYRRRDRRFGGLAQAGPR